MKKIFRKNQVMVTALALMLAVAGYFSFMNENIGDEQIAAEASADLLKEEYEISDEDMMFTGDIFVAEEFGGIENASIANDENNTSLESSGDEFALQDEGTGAEEIANPGEVLFTSASVQVDYAAEMKLSREQVRSKNKETLLEIINNTGVEEALKQDAVNKMIAMTDVAERENAAEMLLEAKGFTDVVVSITGDSCDVVLNMGEVTDAKRAQVEDIVKRKTNISGDKIVITPIVIREE